MSITSFQFILFVIVSVTIYRVIPAKLQWVSLLVTSIVFYLSLSVYGIFVLIVTALITYYFAIQIQNQKDMFFSWQATNKALVTQEKRKEKKEYYAKKQRLYLILAVGINIFILFMFKYYGSLSITLNRRFQVNVWTIENIILPLGISYYSLQLIGYITDVKRDVIKAERNPLKVILYGIFFLSIMQGPFNRYDILMPQICRSEKPKFDFATIKKAALRILWGYVKKMCIADQVGILANEVFSNYKNYSGLAIILAIFCFAIQLYADFAGYMDIMAGIGLLFGIEIPENFNQPFFSKNISEFWQKWHISLGTWLKDYVFYSILMSNPFKKFGKWLTHMVGKEAGRNIPTYVGMLILWTLIGTWHGVGFTYFFSVGLLQFLYIFIGKVTAPISIKAKSALKIAENSIGWRVFQSCRVTILMMFAWIFFNSPSMHDAFSFIDRIFYSRIGVNQVMQIFNEDSSLAGTTGGIFILYILACAVLLIFVDLIHEKGISIRESVISRGYIAECTLVFMLIFALIVFGAYGSQYNPSNFIYFKLF